jgi:transposase, IS30 family
VERTTRFTMLVPLPERYDAPAVAEALTPVIAGLPAALRRSLTWDQGREMKAHAQITVAADCQIYFCDPYSPPYPAARHQREHHRAAAPVLP